MAHGHDCEEDYHLPERDAVQFSRQVQKSRKNYLPPCSGYIGQLFAPKRWYVLG
jgi:hypothetical protein